MEMLTPLKGYLLNGKKTNIKGNDYSPFDMVNILASYFKESKPYLARNLERFYYVLHDVRYNNVKNAENNILGKRQYNAGDVKLGLNAMKQAANDLQEPDVAYSILEMQQKFQELLTPILTELTGSYMGHG